MLKDRFEFLKDAIKKYENRGSYGGKIFKIDLKAGTIEGISHFETPDGYLRCSMCCNNRKKQFYIHEVIAVKGGLDVVDKTINHIDGDKHNNSIDNIEAVTIKENKEHASKNGLTARGTARGTANGNSKITVEEAIHIKQLLKEGLNAGKIAKSLGLNYYTVRNIQIGRTWKHLEI